MSPIPEDLDEKYEDVKPVVDAMEPGPVPTKEPTWEQINELAGILWLNSGGGVTSQLEQDEFWFQAKHDLEAGLT